MNELSLFSGYGGFTLGLKLSIPNIRTIGYVEWEKYPQQIIAARIKDGLLDEAPIFGDIRAFNGEGFAESYQNMVDILTAGFPCPPFSVAGKRKGAADKRNMWPETVKTIRLVRPKCVILENVPGLLSTGERFLIMVLKKIRQKSLFGAAYKKSFTRDVARSLFPVVGRIYFGRILADLAEAGYDCRWDCVSAAEVGANHKRERLWVMAYSKS